MTFNNYVERDSYSQCKLKLTRKLILDIVDVLKLSRSPHYIKPLKLFISEYDGADLEQAQELDIKNNLCIEHYRSFLTYFIIFHPIA